MIYLLDTSIISALMRDHAKAQARLDACPISDQVVICTITRGEVLHGVERQPQGKRRQGLEAAAQHLFARLPCVPLSEQVGDNYATTKRASERKGKLLAENDLWIAAVAFHLGAVLVTTDSDFQRVPGLKLEDWTQ